MCPKPNAPGVPPVPLCAVKSPPWHMNCAPELRVRLRVRLELQVEAVIRASLGLGLRVRANLRDDAVEGRLLVAEAGLHRAQLAEVLRRLGGEVGAGAGAGAGEG